MGSEVIAKCSCGFTSNISIGYGMASPYVCYFPCLCNNCHNIVQMNLHSVPLKCPDCGTENPIPYDNPSLLNFVGSNTVDSCNMDGKFGRKLILTDGKYKCPKCNNMTLQFSKDFLLWD